MGLLRTLLAISVVLSHSYGHIFVGGRLAVQMFYIISGFLISYILIESGSYKNIKSFYINRFLRLFPAYYFISIITFIFFVYLYFIGNDEFFSTFSNINYLGKVYLIFSNIFIIGQDFSFFSGVKNGFFQFMINYHDSDIIVYNGLISHVSWTLSLEIMFYLIAPFIIRNKLLLIIILILSILLRITLIYIDVGLSGGFTYRFFPNELALFILGSLSHQILRPYYLNNNILNSKNLTNIITILFLFFCLIFSFIPFVYITNFLMVFLLLLILPMLFNFQNSNKWDVIIGEYSYPIYICHFLVITIVSQFDIQNIYIFSIWVLLITFLLSHITIKLIIRSVEKIRTTNKVRH